MRTMRNMRAARRRRALTLVEVLVALGVVALLAGLAVPAAQQVRGAARRAQCASNLRQMAIAATQYSAIFDAWPCALRFENPGTFTTVAWDYASDFAGNVRPGALWQFTDDPGEVMQCPAWPGSGGEGLGDPYTGYNYNTSFIGGEAAFPNLGWNAVRQGVRPNAGRRTTTTALFGCGGRFGGTNKFMRAPGNHEDLDWSTIYAGGQAFWHVGGTTNVAWLDGHVSSETQRFEGAHATESLLAQTMDWPDNGFLSNDDRAYDPR